MEHPQKETRTQALAKCTWVVGNRPGARTNLEKSRIAPWPYPSSHEPPISSGFAPAWVSTSRFALASRTFGFALGRSLLPVSRKRLGLVSDGGQAVPPKSRCLSGSSASAREGEFARLVSGDHHHACPHTQTHPSLGLRRGCGYYQAWQGAGLDRSALPFPSHQPIAELPRPTKSPIGWQSPARSALPTYPTSSRSSRWSPFGNRVQGAQRSGAPSSGIACYTHDRSGVLEKERPLPSLSKISRTASAHDYGQRRSHGTKSS